MLRLQKMADESSSSESETEKNDQEPQQRRLRMMLKNFMKEDGERLCGKVDGKPCMKGEVPRGPRARMMQTGPWSVAHNMGNDDGPGLPPQLLRRIRQLVKSMEEE